MSIRVTIGAEIRRLREYKKMTLTELGDLAELSAGFLSQIENGKTSISLDNLNTIALCLDVDVAFFLLSQKQAEQPVILRGFEQKPQPTPDGRFETFLSNPGVRTNILPSILTLPPNEKEGGAFQEQYGDVFLYVIDGILTLQLEEKIERLYPSDSAHFMGTTRYRFWNESSFLTHIFFACKQPRQNNTTEREADAAI